MTTNFAVAVAVTKQGKRLEVNITQSTMKAAAVYTHNYSILKIGKAPGEITPFLCNRGQHDMCWLSYHKRNTQEKRQMASEKMQGGNSGQACTAKS